ncbi:MAG: ATPase [Bacilli bacterium]|nr:ATPase [Bacilli bacterium]
MDQKKFSIGIEFGSTRIKAVVLDEQNQIVSGGDYVWENEYVDGFWSYSLEKAKEGLVVCFKKLREDFHRKTGEKLLSAGAIGISGMMHGYLVLDEKDNLISPFRTWRNTITPVASEKLSEAFAFHVPQRWSISHIYQAILDKREETKRICFATTLAGYFHYLLTKEKVIGVGEASGMFPIDPETGDYDKKMVETFAKLSDGSLSHKITDILPRPLKAGENAGYLTKEGAALLDPSGEFGGNIPLVPPEGDMQTGMVATNSCRKGTGNASFGTSSNTTIVTDKKIGIHPELDVIVTPTGYPAILIHVNNCTTEINHWVSLFKEVIALGNGNIPTGELYEKLFFKALESEDDAGGLLSFNYFSGEAISGINEGRPLIVRTPNSALTLANFMKMHLFSLLCTLKIGIDILEKEEGVTIDKVVGHGGFFKTKEVGQRMLSAALNCPIVVNAAAGEGGPYGMALLASYYLNKEEGEDLEDYLDSKIFAKVDSNEVSCNEKERNGFLSFYAKYLDALALEKKATEVIKVK